MIKPHSIQIMFSRLHLLFFLLALTLTATNLIAAEIKVRVDRNPVNLNESFQLIYSTSESPDDDPDFRVLEQDFEILNQSQSSNISMTNGSFNKNIQWSLTVMAKRAGEIQVPSVAFGSDKSQPARLLVNRGNLTPSSTGQNDSIFIQVSASPERPVVQSQVIYTLRIYRKVNISQASLSEPEPSDAIIEQLGEDSNFNTQHNGESYVVTERKYAIFPQKSGLLTLDPVVLTADILTGKNRRQFGGFFNRPTTRTKRVVSDPVLIDVQPIPADIDASHWLPAEQVHLEQKWSGNIDALQPGEPITRTLTLIVKGATVGQLPELNNIGQSIRSTSKGELKSYPDQPLLKEQKKADRVIAMREEKTAIIPSASGRYQLPAVEVPWWNTQTGQMEMARIPATTVTAVGSAVSEPASTGQIQPTPTPLSNAAENIATEQPNDFWLWLSIFLGLGWLTTLCLWYVNRNKTKPVETSKPQPERLNSKALKQACRDHNPAAAKDALLQWGRMQWQLSSLGSIAAKCEPELQQAILELNKALYSQQPSQWQGDQLMLAFKNQNSHSKIADISEDQVLQPLYKA